MSWAPLGLGHVLQSSVEYVQVNNVLDLLKVEEGGLGTKRSGFFSESFWHLDKRDKTLPEKSEYFVEQMIFPVLNTTKDFAENPSSTSSEHIPHRVAGCLGQSSYIDIRFEWKECWSGIWLYEDFLPPPPLFGHLTARRQGFLVSYRVDDHAGEVRGTKVKAPTLHYLQLRVSMHLQLPLK